jgi:photosystem II stability/assembly factor-like uncharacterized protein
MRRDARAVLRIAAAGAIATAAFAWPLAAELRSQAVDPVLMCDLRWRMIGPFRGGRTVGASGVPGRPNVFFIGVNNGGVWKTTDYGRVWRPVFDDQPTGSIGALAVAPSNPDTIYVGSGEGLQRPDLSTGDGIYRSDDGGRTWIHLGLRDGQQIAALAVDPRRTDRLFAAVLGHPYGANDERGLFCSQDGGASWKRVLFRDADTGAVAVAIDPSRPDVVYASLWAARQAPWENGQWQGPGSGLFKSTDGGATWRPLTKGLPDHAQGFGRIGFDISRSRPDCLYAMVDAREQSGLYRSDDAGESWRRVNAERRICSRGSDFAEVRVHPRDPEIVFVADTSVYRSDDGGATFRCIKGAPGGDDYHTIWIDPVNPDAILLASDQGACITVNGGESWSSWYNQPTAQFYHVITDDRVPYWVYGGQQESGSAAVCSRGRDGQITFREWHPVGAEEYAYVAPDPLHEGIVYAGKVTRFDERTGVVESVAPKELRKSHRVLRTAPLLFSPADPRLLLFATEVLFATRDGGAHWDVISPDLSRERPEVPECIGVYRTDELATMARRGVIYAVAASPLDQGVIWAGTDDGLIHVTRDGGAHWSDVTPPTLTAWSKVSILDAGRFDAGTAYAAINRLRLDDLRPHVLRTHDFGASWSEIDAGLPDDAPVDTVREDPVRRGLLFCGTERAVFVSLDDGDRWHPLRLNMPATSIRDLVVHGDDVVVGTHGRSFWILDDVTPLRQIDEKSAPPPALLFAPQPALLLPRNVNTDTPLPPDEPAGENPPDGAIVDYWLATPPATPLVLEFVDAAGTVVRRFASDDPAAAVDPRELNVMVGWARPPARLDATAGAHRFIWDLRGPPPAAPRPTLPISAIWHDTPVGPLGAAVAPGDYTVRLAADGRVLTQKLSVRPDPRAPSAR